MRKYESFAIIAGVVVLWISMSLFSRDAFAQPAFSLEISDRKTVKAEDLRQDETPGRTDKTSLHFSTPEIRLVAVTGPEDDMLSFRIQGMRNPTLVVPAGSTLKILFVNVDTHAPHDLRFGAMKPPFPDTVDNAATAGSTRLEAKKRDGTLSAEEIVIRTGSTGEFVYLCSVRGHAKGGMWGNIVVGIQPRADLPQPVKMPHVHSPGETPHGHTPPSQTPHGQTPHGQTPGHQPGMAGQHGQMGEMHSTVNIGDPMNRESSGTAWVPDSSPMYAWMKMYKDDSTLMLMGTAFTRYTRIGSDRDASVEGKGSRQRFDAPTMFMAMYSRPINEKSQVGLRAMFSLDAAIQRGYGYPLLYQTGESFRGEPLHDRQHPHDLFSELSASYSYKFNENNSFYFYAGYPGEPALGPPVYIHRVSAMNNPDAPLGHHWQDSTHITFGVLTAGYSFGKFKIEASAFKGQEPDENRWNFDSPKLDSYSGRLSWNPTQSWAFQISHGYLNRPEPLEPELRILRRTTASAIYNKKFSEIRNWASTFVWGQNYGNGERTNSFLFESNYDFHKNAIFGRMEQVQKSGHELVLDPVDEENIYWVRSYSIGYLRDLTQGKGIDVGLGTQFTLNRNPSSLIRYYGGTTHGGWQVFLRFRPSMMKHE